MINDWLRQNTTNRMNIKKTDLHIINQAYKYKIKHYQA